MLVVFSSHMNLGTIISQYIIATTTIKTLKTRINFLLPSRHSLKIGFIRESLADF